MCVGVVCAGMGRLEDALSAVQQEREQEETNPGEAGVAQSDIAKIKEVCERLTGALCTHCLSVCLCVCVCVCELLEYG